MIPYASTTGTRRNLDALRRAGWRLLVTPTYNPTHSFGYALDNGAWSAYQQSRPFNERAFDAALKRLGPQADWTVVPDIVAGGLESLKFSMGWLDRVLGFSPAALIAVQDGMTVCDVERIVGGRVGLFVGGTTDWKLSMIPKFAALARRAGCWIHVGRVNTRRRILLCGANGVDSFDGTSATRYAKTLPLLDWSRRQFNLKLWEEYPCAIS